MENKELNLAELLKNHIGERFYTTAYGDVVLEEIMTNVKYKDTLIVCPTSYIVGRESIFSNGKINNAGEVVIFPDREQRDWSVWMSENKKDTYEEVCKSMFNGGAWYPDTGVNEIIFNGLRDDYCMFNAKSKLQLQKLLAINMLMNVQKYIEDGWHPDWEDNDEPKWYIATKNNGSYLHIVHTYYIQGSEIYFSTEANAQKAITILGEDAIRTAISTEW